MSTLLKALARRKKTYTQDFRDNSSSLSRNVTDNNADSSNSSSNNTKRNSCDLTQLQLNQDDLRRQSQPASTSITSSPNNSQLTFLDNKKQRDGGFVVSPNNNNNNNNNKSPLKDMVSKLSQRKMSLLGDFKGGSTLIKVNLVERPEDNRIIVSLTIVDEDVNAAAYEAICSGEWQVALGLLQDKSILVNLVHGPEQETLLHRAAGLNAVSIIEKLIDRGANVESRDKSERTPLHVACFNGARDVVLLLCALGCKVNTKDAYGYSPLYLSLKQHHFMITSDLLLFGADINFKRDTGMTILHECCFLSDMEMLSFLLNVDQNRPILKWNYKDAHGYSPLFRSAEKATPKFILTLILSKSNLYTSGSHISNNRQQNQQGSNVTSQQIDLGIHDEMGRNLFHHLCLEKRSDVYVLLYNEFLTKTSEAIIFKRLLTEMDLRGFIPLHYAILKNDIETLQNCEDFALLLSCDLLQTGKFPNLYEFSCNTGDTMLKEYRKLDMNDPQRTKLKKDIESNVAIRKIMKKYKIASTPVNL